MIYLNIEATSIDDLKKQMREVLGQTEQPSPQPAVNLCSEPPTQEPVWQTGTSLPAKTSGPADGEPKAEKEPPKEEPVKTYSLADVRAQANALKDRFGIDALRDVFRLHGGEKLKDIPESNYAALMDDLRNLMKEDV